MNSNKQEPPRTRIWEVSRQGSTGNNAVGQQAEGAADETRSAARAAVEEPFSGQRGSGNTELRLETGARAADPGIREAAALLAGGGLVAFPTETVYGLGADARNTRAVEAVFTAKGRPSDNPLIVHIADRAELDALVLGVSEADRKLMDAFWPGPLTLVLPVRPGALSPLVTAGLDTVAVRMPDHDLALSLIRESGCPLAAPSANRSGRPSPTLARHVREDLDGRIDGIVDGGPAGVGVESTVVRTTAAGGAAVLRPGGIPAEDIGRVLGAPVSAVSAGEGADIDPAAAIAAEGAARPGEAAGRGGFAASEPSGAGEGAAGGREARAAAQGRGVERAAAEGGTGSGTESAADPALPGGSSPASADEAADAPAVADEAPRSPGMKYAHYAPSGRLEVVLGGEAAVAAAIRERLGAAAQRGERTGVLAFDEHLASYAGLADVTLSLGSAGDLREAASKLYAALRRFDEEGATFMLAEGCADSGIGSAVMNRLGKAAGGRISRV
ncbi:L-threonylcarbamoyladenylate synthase [Saccharibacillus sp. CPCC 101409]|uniref:L-threonylcarbamoyladenylate synthase n=1 Tax=Saccharibacillus sp. CPCC 101409 TaxID=3058041 RepID=UPI002671C4C7|nr:L-threonylcarbamoyladenylate synthase [Saccharibacillus sp. CPCC 101409]MDO3412129.1 L-threonylcarbamoyladenylate synthase [Saccharibacillus sp. CPCC 101409]